MNVPTERWGVFPELTARVRTLTQARHGGVEGKRLLGQDRSRERVSRKVLVPRAAVWLGLEPAAVLAGLAGDRRLLRPFRLWNRRPPRPTTSRGIHRVRLGHHGRASVRLLEEGRTRALALGRRVTAGRTSSNSKRRTRPRTRDPYAAAHEHGQRRVQRGLEEASQVESSARRTDDRRGLHRVGRSDSDSGVDVAGGVLCERADVGHWRDRLSRFDGLHS